MPDKLDDLDMFPKAHSMLSFDSCEMFNPSPLKKYSVPEELRLEFDWICSPDLSGISPAKRKSRLERASS